MISAFTPINLVIIDDEDLAVDLLISYANETGHLNVIQTFYDPVKALSFLNTSEEVDLILLDLQMPQMHGLDLIRNLSSRIPVILSTSYTEYAFEAYELDVIDYLHKPYLFDRFQHAISKFIDYRQRKKENAVIDDAFFVKGDYKIEKIIYSDVLYIKGLGQYVQIFTQNKIYYSIESMRELVLKLPHQFVRVHKSYIINFQQLQQFTKTQVQINKFKIPIGRTFRKDVSIAFQKLLEL